MMASGVQLASPIVVSASATMTAAATARPILLMFIRSDPSGYASASAAPRRKGQVRTGKGAPRNDADRVGAQRYYHAMQLTERVLVRVTVEEKEAIELLSEWHGRSQSNWARRVLLAELARERERLEGLAERKREETGGPETGRGGSCLEACRSDSATPAWTL